DRIWKGGGGYEGNKIACSNCDLNAGTKKFAIPMFGLFEQFPQYSARSGAKIPIEDRVNSCMQRSMNGHAMPLDAPQIPAIIAYIKFLSTGVPAGQRVSGLGVGKMPELNVPLIPNAVARFTPEPATTATDQVSVIALSHSISDSVKTSCGTGIFWRLSLARRFKLCHVLARSCVGLIVGVGIPCDITTSLPWPKPARRSPASIVMAAGFISTSRPALTAQSIEAGYTGTGA